MKLTPFQQNHNQHLNKLKVNKQAFQLIDVSKLSYEDKAQLSQDMAINSLCIMYGLKAFEI